MSVISTIANEYQTQLFDAQKDLRDTQNELIDSATRLREIKSLYAKALEQIESLDRILKSEQELKKHYEGQVNLLKKEISVLGVRIEEIQENTNDLQDKNDLQAREIDDLTNEISGLSGQISWYTEALLLRTDLAHLERDIARNKMKWNAFLACKVGLIVTATVSTVCLLAKFKPQWAFGGFLSGVSLAGLENRWEREEGPAEIQFERIDKRLGARAFQLQIKIASHERHISESDIISLSEEERDQLFEDLGIN